ncbi:methionine adenosyltransferase 2 subunit beta [Quillaja saponaria]|uniref:Methionine adenosyltransferase 2 subunit beta n=1 Tax=Quillaja saponaria TaxID=32244 RepID=A0AAD7PNH9_QUISA|nr:methionine adenosyltransferase 2 subunit beta [Quillaja saponaria]
MFCIQESQMFPRPVYSFGSGSYCKILYAVYDHGEKSLYKEERENVPVIIYGKSKVAAEEFILEMKSGKISNFGPQAISPVPKPLPIQVLSLYTLLANL